MITPTLIAFITAAGIGAWIYDKIMQRTGGNTQNAIVTTLIVSFMVFVITLTMLGLVDNFIENKLN